MVTRARASTPVRLPTPSARSVARSRGPRRHISSTESETVAWFLAQGRLAWLILWLITFLVLPLLEPQLIHRGQLLYQMCIALPKALCRYGPLPPTHSGRGRPDWLLQDYQSHSTLSTIPGALRRACGQSVLYLSTLFQRAQRSTSHLLRFPPQYSMRRNRKAGCSDPLTYTTCCFLG